MNKVLKWEKKCFIVLGVLVFIIGLTNIKDRNWGGVKFLNNPKGDAIPLEYNFDVYKESALDQWGSTPSMTFYKDRKIIAAGYIELRCLDFSDGVKVKEIHCPSGYSTVSNCLGTGLELWNPTGVFYDVEKDILYIANYHGGNILVCRMGDDLNLHVLGEITDSDMVSPENVCVKNHRIAVADYDGNKLFLFSEDGKLEWKKDIQLAHGVTMSEDSVYVTSLLERKIIRYDYEGNLIKEIGELGFEGYESFMWPTSLEYWQGQVIVTDAHTGRIYCFNDELEYESSIGANGPSNNTFNFPYCSIVSEEGIYVSDVFNMRIVKLGFDGKIMHIFGNRINGIQDNLALSSFEGNPYSYGVLTEIDSKVFNPYISAKVISGYNGLLFKDNEDGSIRKVNYSAYMQNGDFLDWSIPKVEQPYCTFVYKYCTIEKEYYIILSPQLEKQCFVYDISDGIGFLTNSYMVPIWCVDNNWYSEKDVEIQLKELIQYSQEYIDSFTLKIEEGIDRREAYEEVFLGYYNKTFAVDMTKAQFHEWLGKWFTSEAGKEFWKKYGKENVEEITEEYFLKTSKGTSETYLCEALFVRMFGANL